MKKQIVSIICIAIVAQIFLQGVYANHCIRYNPSTRTITVVCGSASLSDIDEQLVDRSILKQESRGIWMLNANLNIANGAIFYINSTDASWLKINSTTAKSAYNIDIFGNLDIDSVKITSWNSTSDNYTTTDGKVPRASITIMPKASGKTDIVNSEISYLGYNSTLRNGLGYYGGNGGILANNTIHDIWNGPHLEGIGEIKIQDNRISVVANHSNQGELQNGSNLIKNPGAKVDLVPPLLAITSPTFNATIPHKRILVEGTAFDPGLGIKQVEVLSQTYPIDNNMFDYELATPGAAGNWSTWTIPINITSISPHRILAMATDMAGNQNWAEVTVNVPFDTTPTSSLVGELPKHRVAFVQSSFTAGAYNVGGFYTFYPKYASVTLGSSVTTNLRNLTAVIPEKLADERFYGPLNGQIKQFAPEAIVNIIRDEDVHNGYIFGSDGRNAYDVLFLLHDEYATPSTYDNFKRFVSNGGTIVFLDGNVFYAQVAYNKNMHTVTLVKGHDWEFNGTAATKSVHERYFNETKEWVGSNFLYSDINVPIPFENNPFNYTHFEENYVNNPNATILLDYGAQHVYRDDKARTPVKVATYELDYGKGKVIVIGLYGQSLVGNQEFLRFFKDIILPRSIGHTNKFADNGNEFGINWWINTGNVTKIGRDGQSNALVVTLGRSEQKADNLVIILPRELIGSGDPNVYNFTITVNGKKVPYNRTSDDIETGFAIPLTKDATNIHISTAANIEIAEGAAKPNNANFFTPAIINITRGTTIFWTNNDNEIHTVTYGDPDSTGPKGTLFDSGAISSGRSFHHTFKDSGDFEYYCTLHPFMTGKVHVK